jgi:hypothetical protein
VPFGAHGGHRGQIRYVEVAEHERLRPRLPLDAPTEARSQRHFEVEIALKREPQMPLQSHMEHPRGE